jgi:hypothetical protein
MKTILLIILAAIISVTVYMFLYGKLFPFSPVVTGFRKSESEYMITYIQNGAVYDKYKAFDTLIHSIEKFHDLEYLKKPEIFIFRDSLTYIRHSLSKARLCAFPNGRLFISPWALRESLENKISLEVYLKHELSHILIFQQKGILAAFRYPKWLLEGIAVYSSGQMGTAFYPGKEETYRLIASGNFMPPEYFKTRREDDIRLNVKYRQTFIYSEYACMVDYLAEMYGRKKLLDYLKTLINDHDHDKVFRDTFGIDFEHFQTDFKKYASANNTGNTFNN